MEYITEEGYPIYVVGRHMLVTDAMKNYALEKVKKIDRLKLHIIDMQIVLDEQKNNYLVSILVKFEHCLLKVHSSTTDMYASIDDAAHKLQAQMRKWKRKIHDHHRVPVSSIDLQVNVLGAQTSEVDEINDEIEEENLRHQIEESVPEIIANEVIALKTLSTSEAMMRMELSQDAFLLFRDKEDKKLKVIYRRDDGNFAIIQAE